MQDFKGYSTAQINGVLREAIRCIASSIARLNFDAAQSNKEQLGLLYASILSQGILDGDGFPSGLIRPSEAAEMMEVMLKSGGNRFAMMDKNYRKAKCGIETVIVGCLRSGDVVAAVAPENACPDLIMTFAAFVRRHEKIALEDVYRKATGNLFTMDFRGLGRLVASVVTGETKYRRQAFDTASRDAREIALRLVPAFIESENFILERVEPRTSSTLRKLLEAGIVSESVDDVRFAQELVVKLRGSAFYARTG